MNDIPYQYQELERCYVSPAKYDFFVTFSAYDLVLEIKYQMENYTKNNMLFGGTGADINNTYTCLYNNYNSGVFRLYGKDADGGSMRLTFYGASQDIWGDVHTILIDSSDGMQVGYCDGGHKQLIRKHISEEVFREYRLFCYNIDTFPYRFAGYFHYLKISKHDGTVLYDLIPVKRKSDGVVGLYNKADGTFWYDENASLYEDKPSET